MKETNVDKIQRNAAMAAFSGLFWWIVVVGLLNFVYPNMFDAVNWCSTGTCVTFELFIGYLALKDAFGKWKEKATRILFGLIIFFPLFLISVLNVFSEMKGNAGDISAVHILAIILKELDFSVWLAMASTVFMYTALIIMVVRDRNKNDESLHEEL
ncbi:MAG: hypothetical protein IJ744_12630 [Lachnospiraceae bacterium]|nr:hypothetical protein [Lachnospiraceae bacterium]